jgi:anti-sigma regulatory factor (Ser/Thr protein kinase)
MGAVLVKHSPISASVVRHELATDLDLHGVDQVAIDEASLVASELVGNAVRHAGASEDGELDVSWSVGRDDIVVSVADPSTTLPVAREVAPDAPGGRGLRIIQAIATDWGVEPVPGGKRVWAKIRRRRS